MVEFVASPCFGVIIVASPDVASWLSRFATVAAWPASPVTGLFSGDVLGDDVPGALVVRAVVGAFVGLSGTVLTMTGPSVVGVSDGLLLRAALLAKVERVAVLGTEDERRDDSRLGDVVLGGSDDVITDVAAGLSLPKSITSVS